MDQFFILEFSKKFKANIAGNFLSEKHGQNYKATSCENTH
jgi:hypothetical protein